MKLCKGVMRSCMKGDIKICLKRRSFYRVFTYLQLIFNSNSKYDRRPNMLTRKLTSTIDLIKEWKRGFNEI